ncbi:MAG: hypothetical protein JJU41_08030 [Bacteroidetes bacterium]|nr:hypothetical protein [Bacteroidota bacterium]
MSQRLFIFAAVFVFVTSLPLTSAGQPGIEPPVRGVDTFRTPLDDDLRRAAAFNLVLNNFGFGIAGEYRRVVSPLSEIYAELQITALRDVTEQNYQFFGQQIIPNKRNRVLSFPLTLGFKHRIFPQPISDNFRFFVSAQGGPTLAFIYPYYNAATVRFVMEDDLATAGNLNDIVQIGRVEANIGQFVNDVFQGWGDGDWMLGTAGQIGIGVDFGERFNNVTTLKIGFTFSHFAQGIQVMDPLNAVGIIPTPDFDSDVFVLREGTPKQTFFGSPFITLSFGNMW